MAKLETTYIRRRNKIYREDGKTLYQEFPSVSSAKRHSLMLQGGISPGDKRGGAATVNRVLVDRSADPKPKRNGKRQDAADKFLTESLRKEQAARVAQNLEHKVKQAGTNTISLKYKTNAQPESLNEIMVEKIRASQGLDARGNRK